MKTTSTLIRTSMLAAPLAMAAGMASAGGMAEPVIAPAPAPAPVMAPAPVRMGSDWTGFYAGGQIGYGQLDSDALADDTDGLTYGVHAGYLYDLGTIVLGAELDVDGTEIEDDAADIALDSVARAKLRVGYDAGVWMPYLTAGVARATTSGALDETDDGSFAGLGLDYQVSNNIRVGGEVLQHQFDDFGGAADIDATTASARVSFSF
ncbi:outer membrane protein [Loktanella sp. Alg231-35]|uniref:outer membrane protein n=1 Tax=Loktanella sp. Alg231-35 TaxID=1922220 RepID=UPI000D5584DC|nr:outer membrane beta-barrel protein [Loktanella sp. Alg231-35]